MVDFPYIFGLLVSEQVPWEAGVMCMSAGLSGQTHD